MCHVYYEPEARALSNAPCYHDVNDADGDTNTKTSSQHPPLLLRGLLAHPQHLADLVLKALAATNTTRNTTADTGLRIWEVVLTIPVLPLHHFPLAQGHNLELAGLDDPGAHRQRQGGKQRRGDGLGLLRPAHQNDVAQLVGQVETCIPTGALESHLLEALWVEPAELRKLLVWSESELKVREK